MVRSLLKTIAALLAAWMECATAKRACVLGRIKEILVEGRPNKLELALIALALSALAGGLLFPGEFASFADTIRTLHLF